MNKQIEEMAKILCKPTANKGNCEKCGFKKDCSKFYDAINLYNAGYRKQEWSLVTKKPPELFEDVLCYYPNKKGKNKVRMDYLEDKEELSFGFEFCEGKVTHWTPIPEPPEEECGGILCQNS